MDKKRFLKISLSKFIFLLSAFLCISNINAQDSTIKMQPVRILVGGVTFGPEAKQKINVQKAEAGLNLAIRLSRKYEMISPIIRDSVINELKKKDEKLNIEELFTALQPDKMYFAHIDILANMLRMEVSSLDIKSQRKATAAGFALAHYFEKGSELPVYDPAILEAAQRAIALVENDSNLYADVDSVFQVKPVPTLVISSLIFSDNDSLDTWDLFTEKEIKSYFAIETIFEQAVKTHNFAVYDIASRDSIYKLFNLSIPENFRAPTTIELSCLENLKVDYYITGEFKRTEAGASVSLFLMQIVDKSVVLVKKESEFLYEDSLVKFKDVLLSLTKKLIE